MGHSTEINPTEKMVALSKRLGVKIGKSFRVKLVNRKEKTLDSMPFVLRFNNFSRMVFMIGDELFIMGEYDGFSQWYGGNQLYSDLMEKGLLIVNKEQTKKTSLI